MKNDQRSWRLWICSGFAILAGLALVAIVITRCSGFLPTYAGQEDESGYVRATVILLIRSMTLLLGVVGVLHAARSTKVSKAEVDELAERLERLADVAPSPELLLEVAHQRDNDLWLQMMHWGTRSALLLGLLGTVWGLSLAVSPIAQAVAEATAGPTQLSHSGSDQGMLAQPAPDVSIEVILTKTGEAVGSLQTAFSTTLWGVVAAFSLLFLSTLCSAAREIQIIALAEAALRQGQVLENAKKNREGARARSSKDLLQSAAVMCTAVGQFSAAAASIESHQQLYETALNKLDTTLNGIAQQIQAALTPVADRLTEAAVDVKNAAASLRRASTDSKTKIGDAAERLERSAEALKDAAQSILQQQQASVNAYQQELTRVVRDLEPALAAINTVVEQLPGTISASTLPALEDWSQKQLQDQQRVIESLHQSLEALQQFLYWADQSTDKRELRQEQLQAQISGTLQTVAQDTQEGIRATHEHLRAIAQAAETLQRQEQLHSQTNKAILALAQHARESREGERTTQGHLRTIAVAAETLQRSAASVDTRLGALGKLEQALPAFQALLGVLPRLESALPELRGHLETLAKQERERTTAGRQGFLARFGRGNVEDGPAESAIASSGEQPGSGRGGSEE